MDWERFTIYAALGIVLAALFKSASLPVDILSGMGLGVLFLWVAFRACQRR